MKQLLDVCDRERATGLPHADDRDVLRPQQCDLLLLLVFGLNSRINQIRKVCQSGGILLSI